MPGLDPTRLALGTWSGGRFMHFGEPLDDERYEALITPDAAIPTVLTADVYGAGEADERLGRALANRLGRAGQPARAEICVIGAVGHDFYNGQREGAKGFPRFTDPRLRSSEGYADYLRMATERSLERIGIDAFDVLLLHNPDRTGYTSEVVWNGMVSLREAGLTRRLGVAPGPANGFTLDLIDCFERFGSVIDWAMIILSPLEPWPGELCLDAAGEQGIKVITRVVDHGGVFFGDLEDEAGLAEYDHRKFRPAGWIDAAREKVGRMEAIAARHRLTPIQLSCAWNLAHPAVRSVVPTLIQERGGRPVEEKRAELAALPEGDLLSVEEVDEIRRIGDNSGCMALKGASPAFAGEERPDAWAVEPRLLDVAARWQIEPERDLVKTM